MHRWLAVDTVDVRCYDYAAAADQLIFIVVQSFFHALGEHDLNENTTTDSVSMACRNVRLRKLNTQKKMRKHVLTSSRREDGERFCGFCGQQRKQISGCVFLIKLE